MAVKEDLQIGQKYWFLSVKHDKLVELTFMNKVHQRRAFRFAEAGKKQLFIVHNSRLDYTYANEKEAKKAYKVYMGKRTVQQVQIQAQVGVRAYYTGNIELRPPDINAWAVGRGFPRRVRFGRW